MFESEPKRELKGVDVPMGRSSSGSEVVVMDDRILEAAANSAVPPVHTLNVTKSSRVHIGPKFVSVTQNVDNTEVVKGRILGLELVSPKNTRRLSCSIAVFVCWALVVACALTFLIFQYALAKQVRRLDIDLPLPGYLWNIAKSTTKAEKLSCAAAITLLVICIALIVYFVVTGNKKSKELDVAPHEWFINRDQWLAPPFNTTERMDEFEPVRLVIIAHTAGPVCDRFQSCAAQLRNLQNWCKSANGYDISYNFLIGNDGRVYEGRGWGVVGAHTHGYNRCSIGIGFMGDYREGQPSYTKVSEIQLKRANMILAQGVELGHIHPRYQVVGAKDLKPTVSPGENLYKTIQQWKHFAHNNVFKNRTCQEIRSMFEIESSTTAEPEEITSSDAIPTTDHPTGTEQAE